MSAAARTRSRTLQRWAAALWPSFAVAFAATALLAAVLPVEALLECTATAPIPGAPGGLDPLGLYSLVFLALWAVGAVAALAAIALLAGERG